MDNRERELTQPGAAQEHRQVPPREGQVGRPNVRNWFKAAQANAAQSRHGLARLQNNANISKEVAGQRKWKTRTGDGLSLVLGGLAGWGIHKLLEG